MIGGYEEAIKLAWQIISASEINSTYDPINLKLLVYGTLSGMYQHTGKTDSALIVHRMAIAEAMHYPNDLTVTPRLNNTGLYFYNLGNYDSAWVYFNFADSLLKARSSNINYWIKFHGSVKDNIATIYEEQGEFEKAETIYKENFSMYQEFNAIFRWVNAGISLANAQVHLNNYRDAKESLNYVSSLMDTVDYKDKQTSTLHLFEVYAKYYRRTNDMKNAFMYQEKVLNLLDSLNKRKVLKHNKSASVLAGYASERFGQKLQLEKSEREKEEQRSRLLLWILILIIVASLTIFHYFRQRIKLQEEKVKLNESNRMLTEEKLKTQENEQRLLNLELEYKKKDISDMALSLKLKQDWARDVNQHIKNIESAKGNKRSREFKILKDEIRNQIYVDGKLEILQQNIDMLNKEFFDKLSSKFPGLTKTEKKFCSFIKLNLTTTEIANLQNIDPTSVKVSRYRLKKRLNLRPEQDLDAFLQTF